MARKFKVEGKSIKQLMRLRPSTISRMDAATLGKVVTRLSSAANKRARRIAAKGISTPATRAMERSGGKFSSKGKDINELRTEYKRVKSFLKSETSTIKGYTKFAQRFEKKLQKVRNKENRKRKSERLTAPVETPPDENGEEYTEKETEEEEKPEDEAGEFYDKYDKVFRAVDRLKELNPWIGESLSSPVVAMTEEYINQNPNISVDDAVDILNKQIKEYYETQTKRDKSINWTKLL